MNQWRVCLQPKWSTRSVTLDDGACYHTFLLTTGIKRELLFLKFLFFVIFCNRLQFELLILNMANISNKKVNVCKSYPYMQKTQNLKLFSAVFCISF